MRAVHLWVDACCGGGATPLIPSGGEYVQAVARFTGREELSAVPHEVFLHLYAYEVLERMRERLRDDGEGTDEVWGLPLWPASLFDAAGIPCHAAAELETLHPGFTTVTYVPRPYEEVAREGVRLLGAPRFDADRYLASVRDVAATEAWLVRS